MRGVKPFVGIKNDEVISKIELGGAPSPPSRLSRLPLPPHEQFVAVRPTRSATLCRS